MLIWEAQDCKGDLAVLDLTSTYGYTSHKLVETFLDRYHIWGKTSYTRT